MMISTTNLVEYVYCWRIGALMPHHTPCTECGQKNGHGDNIPWHVCFLCGVIASPVGDCANEQASTGDTLRCACSTYVVTDDGMMRTGDKC